MYGAVPVGIAGNMEAMIPDGAACETEHDMYREGFVNSISCQ
jgi:hypothetical protein